MDSCPLNKIGKRALILYVNVTSHNVDDLNRLLHFSAYLEVLPTKTQLTKKDETENNILTGL